MMAGNSPIYLNNHLKLMKFHIVLAVVYFLFWLASVCLSVLDKDTSILLPLILGAAVCLHALLAYGSKNRIESSRKASEFIGALFMFGFPVGTLLGYFFLQCTIWQEPEETPQSGLS